MNTQTTSTTEKLEAVAFECVVCDLPVEDIRNTLAGMSADKLCASFRCMSDDAVRHVFDVTGREFTDALLAKLTTEDATAITDRLPARDISTLPAEDEDGETFEQEIAPAVEPYPIDEELEISHFVNMCKNVSAFHDGGFCWVIIALCIASIAAFAYTLFANTISYGVVVGMLVWGLIFVPFAIVYTIVLQISARRIRREYAHESLREAYVLSNRYLEKYHDTALQHIPNNKQKCKELLHFVMNLASEHESDDGRFEADTCHHACEQAICSLRDCNFAN